MNARNVMSKTVDNLRKVDKMDRLKQTILAVNRDPRSSAIDAQIAEAIFDAYMPGASFTLNAAVATVRESLVVIRKLPFDYAYGRVAMALQRLAVLSPDVEEVKPCDPVWRLANIGDDEDDVEA